LTWIPFPYIFETDIIPMILNNFLVPSNTRIEAIKFFGEIASLKIAEATQKLIWPSRKRFAFHSASSFKNLSEITKDRSLCEEYRTI